LTFFILVSTDINASLVFPVDEVLISVGEDLEPL
jgi:hypothetical protein